MVCRPIFTEMDISQLEHRETSITMQGYPQGKYGRPTRQCCSTGKTIVVLEEIVNYMSNLVHISKQCLLPAESEEHEVFCCLEVFRKKYFRLVTKIVQIEKKPLKYWFSRAVYSDNTPLGHYTDCGPMGLGQYNSLRE